MSIDSISIISICVEYLHGVAGIDFNVYYYYLFILN